MLGDIRGILERPLLDSLPEEDDDVSSATSSYMPSQHSLDPDSRQACVPCSAGQIGLDRHCHGAAACLLPLMLQNMHACMLLLLCQSA